MEHADWSIRGHGTTHVKATCELFTLFWGGHGLGALALNMKAPEVVHPSVGLKILQLLQVFTELVVQTIGQDLAVFSMSHKSFCLFENRSGMLYWRGFCIFVIK